MNYMTKYIELTRNKVSIVDDEDYDCVNMYNWCATYIDGHWYAVRTVSLNKKKVMIYLHRFIMNPENDKFVDHKNGDGLDNTRGNLRICTNTQNISNKRIGKNNTSGYKGVDWQEHRKKWRSTIKVNRKQIFLGRFEDVIDAAKAYDIAARFYFGEFALTNFQE